jgi:hypothetical protein
MKLARIIRFSIIKFQRYWKAAFKELGSEIAFSLAPLIHIKNVTFMSDESQRGGEPRKENENTANVHSSPADEHNPDQPTTSAPAAQINPPPSAADDPKDEEKKCIDAFEVWLKRHKHIIEFGGFLIGIFLLIGAGCQIYEIGQDRIISNRAWVSGSLPTINGYSATNVGLRVDLVNSGKTPAYVDKIEVSVTAFGDGYSNNIAVNQPTQKHIIRPDGASRIVIGELNPIGKPAFDSLSGGEIRHGFYIKIWYRDAFKNKRHTCIGYSIGGSLDSMTTIPYYGEPIMN